MVEGTLRNIGIIEVDPSSHLVLLAEVFIFMIRMVVQFLLQNGARDQLVK